MEHNYRISHHFGDSGFEIESTDKDWIDKKEKEYLSRLSEKPIKKQRGYETNILISGENFQPNLTVDEFYRQIIKSSKVTSRPEMAVFFVYYLSKIAKKDSIKTSDVLDCFKEISYPNYNKINMTDVLSKAKRKALLNNVNNQWSLTLTGEDYVLNFLTNPEK